MLIANEDCKVILTSFVVPDGHNSNFNKVPFGSSTSPSVFQRGVYSTANRELMRKGGVVIIYMDDLIIPAKDEKEGLEN
ncbi:retrovirus-related Pol polyprotein from transposon 17.6 [Trichonephila inaurata madagascariensis]|uniref:Retrovirus-related Pol polyprotein from transposon 17.6 n=1 Tax=Trichonephila inaurata madagascariensis TaxID=2747483 RepID=A0A8X6WQS3_9ARAC|nr:retrovirus-related Pol polyprotein from transposon 17.6 [Trichonephila inaurata madagascariensis]